MARRRGVSKRAHPKSSAPRCEPDELRCLCWQPLPRLRGRHRRGTWAYYHPVPDHPGICLRLLPPQHDTCDAGRAARCHDVAIGLALSTGLKTGEKFLFDSTALLFGALAFAASVFLKLPLIAVLAILSPPAFLVAWRHHQRKKTSHEASRNSIAD